MNRELRLSLRTCPQSNQTVEGQLLPQRAPYSAVRRGIARSIRRPRLRRSEATAASLAAVASLAVAALAEQQEAPPEAAAGAAAAAEDE